MRRTVLVVSAIAAMFLSVELWVHRYRFDHVRAGAHDTAIRTNLFTGEVDEFDAQYGWMRLRNPYADLLRQVYDSTKLRAGPEHWRRQAASIAPPANPYADLGKPPVNPYADLPDALDSLAASVDSTKRP